MRNINYFSLITRAGLFFIAFAFVFLFLIMPLISIFYEAFRHGVEIYFKSISDHDALSALKLTLTVCLVILPINLFFGILAAFCIARYEFKGKIFLVTLIDLPFSVSPVISGFIYLILFSSDVCIGNFFINHDIQIIFAFPGIVLVTLFVTVPFVAKSIIPIIQEQGKTQEEAGSMLGANSFEVFWHITLPNIKWGIISAIVLLTARSIGEFGAVSVISGHIRGQTNTIPLHVEVLYNEYNFQACFAAASILTIMSIITIIIKILADSSRKSIKII